MTEKRYKAIPETASYKDTVTGEILCPKHEKDYYKVLNLLNENKQLKQFKEKVFSLFDKEIAQNEEAIEWGKETGADSGSMGFYNHMLKRLKKELRE